MSDDLSTVTTDELILELKKRSTAIVIGIEPIAFQGCFKVIRDGSKLAVAGLIRNLQLESDYDLMHDPRDPSAQERMGGEPE